MKPQNFEEKLVWYYILGTYVWYFLGCQFVLGPALGWFLMLYLVKKLWEETEDTPDEEKVTRPSFSVWVWIVSMLIMEVAVIAAHLDWNLGTSKLIGATLVWARSWALMALFPLAGCLNIRPRLIYRAVCIVCLQSIFFLVFNYLMYNLGQNIYYVGPFWKILRGDPTPYSVNLYTFDEFNNEFRQQLFTPYPNSLGIVATVFFLLASQESDKKWRWIGMVGAAAMVMSSLSRMTTLCLIIVPILTWLLTNFSWRLQITAAATSFVCGIFAPQIIEFVTTNLENTFSSYRASSKVIRDRLREISLDQWKNAPVWGHGVVLPKGPKVTEFMPIGTHHQWAGILYLKGVVGLAVFIFSLVWSFIDLLIKAQITRNGKVAFSIFLNLLICTSAAEIEAPAYLYWPGLVMIGIAFKEKVPLLMYKNQEYSHIK